MVAALTRITHMSKPRILIIEDERDLCEVLTYNLHKEGFETLVAHDGQEGFEHLGISLDKIKHPALAKGRELDLTPTEFRLLECMLRQPGRAFTRQQLMDAAIEEGAVVLERTIDVHVKSLRRKLGGESEFIETVRGVGYRFREGTCISLAVSRWRRA